MDAKADFLRDVLCDIAIFKKPVSQISMKFERKMGPKMERKSEGLFDAIFCFSGEGWRRLTQEGISEPSPPTRVLSKISVKKETAGQRIAI